jgi:dTDP-glucose 4,6-dehydratase
LVTGGAGFIGANFLNHFVPKHPECQFLNLDALTYAGHLANLVALEKADNYRFLKLDLTLRSTVHETVADFRPELVIHFAAETHVDRSIKRPIQTVESNVSGTQNLLEACRNHCLEQKGFRFHHVSTDEVYGSLGESGAFKETDPYDPRSPYSASKAASDYLVRAYGNTYGLPYVITNCSNNYGPFQFPEKLIPLMTYRAAQGKSLPVYGDGSNRRDWLYVIDHAEAIWRVATEAPNGETYNVGGGYEAANLEIVRLIAQIVAEERGEPAEPILQRIEFVKDRPGHDWRYAIDSSKIQAQLGWQPRFSFEEGLRQTVKWYLDNEAWAEKVTDEQHRQWLEENYDRR